MTENAFSLADAIAQAKGWDNVTRQIMLAGKQVAQPDPSFLCATYQVSGCQSQVYLWRIGTANGTVEKFSGWSDAKIIRGVLAVLLEKANALPIADVSHFDFSAYLADLGLSRHLSQSRADGISQVIKQLHSLARQ